MQRKIRFKEKIRQIDLHIVMLMSMIMPLFLVVISNIILKEIHITKFSVGYYFSILIFLFPQGMIFTRNIKIISWMPKIQNRDSFWINELLSLYFVVILWIYLLIGSWSAWLMFGVLFLLLYWANR